MEHMKRHHEYYEDEQRPDRRIGGVRALLGLATPVVAIVAILLLVGGIGTILAAPASAHASFLGADPAEGTVVTELPGVVVLTYSEEIAPQFVATAVVPPGGEPVATEASAAGADVSVDLAAAHLPADVAGTWSVVARVVSVDGHPVEHTTTFEVAAAAASQPSATPPSAPSAEPPAAPSTAPPSAVAGPSATGPSVTAEPSPSPVATDPVAAVTDGLPVWAAVLLAAGAVGAAVVAVVVQLRRRPPGSTEEQ